MAGFDEKVGRRDAGQLANRGGLKVPATLLESIDRRTMSSPNASVLQLHGGQVVIPRRTPPVSSVAVGRLVVIKGVTEKRVSVTDGLVNDVTPTLGGDDLDDDPIPETGDLTVGTNYVWVKTVGTFGTPDTYAVTIEVTTSLTPPTAEAISGTAFTSCRILAKVVLTAVTFARTITLHHEGGDLAVESFGSVNYWWPS